MKKLLSIKDFIVKQNWFAKKMKWNTETQRHRALFFERTEFTE